MKRKLVAMVLGMAVTLTSLGSVYAAEAESISAEATESVLAEEAAQEDIAVWGEVMSVDEQSITVAVGTLAGTEEMEEEAGAVSAEEVSEEAIAEEVSEEAIAEDEAAVLEKEAVGEGPVTLLPNDEEMTIAITEETKVYLVYGDVVPAELERVAAEYAGLELEAEEMESTETTEGAADAEAAEEMVYVNETDTASILEGDLAGIILDEDGNAQTILVVLPDFEPIELTEDAALNEAVEDAEAIEIIEEEIVTE